MLLISLATDLRAEEPDYGEAVRYKLGAGFSNMLLGMGEIPKNVINTANESNALFGVTGGVVKGILHTMGRTLAGAVDVLTFPAPTKPITTPVFIWQNWRTETSYGPYFTAQKALPPKASTAAQVKPVNSP